ncbi:hypothetical protein BDV97DRAFT_353183 [Delphinella strobiligena]|nr:hypothetical protein BDV97DRAFT_353183 [Delphinella strobiligena]
MQAIQITSFLPDTLHYSNLGPTRVPRPIPEKDELIIRITHVSLQQVDLLFSRGKHQNNNAKHGHVHPPFILGLEFAGIIESVPAILTAGDRTPSLQLGDAVMGTHYGSFAEYMCIKPDEAMKIPPNLSFAAAAAAALAGGAVGYAAVTKAAKVEPGQTVLVTGANGGLGIVACQVAKACGAKVIALVSSSDRAELLQKQLSLDHVITTEKPTWVEQVQAISDGKGIDAIIDNVGFVEEGLRCLKLGGCIVIVGFAGRGGVMEKVAMNKILLKGARVIGLRFGEQSRQEPSYLEEVLQGYRDLLSSGRVKAVLDPRKY